MSEIKNSDYKTYDLHEDPKYKEKLEYILCNPKTTSTYDYKAQNEGDIIFETPDKCVNWSKSYLNFTATLTNGFDEAKATDATITYHHFYQNTKTPPYIVKVQYKPDKDGVAIVDDDDTPMINNQITPYETSFEEFKNKTPHNFYMYPTNTNQYLTDRIITTSSTNSTFNTNANFDVCVNNRDPQYWKALRTVSNAAASISATSDACSESMRYSLKDVARDTFFSINKMVTPSPKGVGSVTLRMGHPEYFLQVCSGTTAAASNPNSGTKTAYAGKLTITNIEIWLACEGNGLVEKQMKYERDTKGIDIIIPFRKHHTEIMSSRANHRVTLNIEPSYGTYIGKVYASVTNTSENQPTPFYRYDFNNISNSYDFDQSDTNVTVSASYSSAVTPIKIASYFYKLNGKREQQTDLSIAKLDDYTQSEQTLEGSIISNPISFYQNWSIIHDFTRGDKSSDISPKGELLGKSTLQWEIDAKTPSNTNIPLNWELTTIYGRRLIINSSGVTLI